MSLLAATLLAIAPGPIPVPPPPPLPPGSPPRIALRADVEDEEIVWFSDAQGRYWREVLQAAAAAPEVRHSVETRGLTQTCNWFSNLRGGTIARYFRPYGRAVVSEFRREATPARLVDAAESGPWTAGSRIGRASFGRAMARAAEIGRPSVESAARHIAARLAVWGWGDGPESVRDRPRPETLAALQREPALLPFWCSMPAANREQAVGGYSKGVN